VAPGGSPGALEAAVAGDALSKRGWLAAGLLCAAVVGSGAADAGDSALPADGLRLIGSVGQASVAGGKRPVAGVALVLLDRSFSQVEVALLAVSESTQLSSTFQPAAGFTGLGAEVRAPFAAGMVTLSPGVRVSGGSLQSIGPPTLAAPNPYDGTLTWTSHSAALLLAPSLEVRLPLGEGVWLTAGLGYRFQIGADGPSSLGGPQATLGLGVPTFADAQVAEKGWALRLEVERLGISGDSGRRTGLEGLGVRLGPEWSWPHARFGLALAERQGLATEQHGNLGLDASLRLYLLNGARALRPFFGAGVGLLLAAFGDFNIQTTKLAYARAGLDLRVPGSQVELSAYLGAEAVASGAGATTPGLRVGLGLGI
jgi:hypothetical protein